MNSVDLILLLYFPCECRTPSGHVNEYSSIYESNGSDGPRSTQGQGQGTGAGSSSNRPLQSSERSASRGEGSGRNASASASKNSTSCSSYQAEEGHDKMYHGGKPFLPVASAPFHFAQSGNDECKQELEHDYGHEKFSSPLRGYFSLPPQDLPGTASTSSTDCSTALPTSPFDRELGLGLGAEGREERGRGAGRGREGGTGTGRGKARDRDRSIDSTLSLTSESSYVAAIESCRHSKRSQSVQYEGRAGAALGLDYQSTHPSIGSKIGLLLYDSDRKWGSWLGL